MAKYEGLKPVGPMNITSDPFWGNKKYVDYQHLFTDVESCGKSSDSCLFYGSSRAKKIPVEIPEGATVRFTANFKSSILTKITGVKILKLRKGKSVR